MQERLWRRRAAKSGGNGVIAELVRIEKEGGAISRDERWPMLFLLLFAGHETTTHLISGSVRELLLNPGLRDWLEEDWSQAEQAVEEFCGFVSPVQFTKPRYVPGCRARRRPSEERRQGHGHAGRREHGSAGERPSGKARSRARPNRHVAFGAGSISAWVTSSRELKASARCRPCSSAGRSSPWRRDFGPRWRTRTGIRALSTGCRLRPARARSRPLDKYRPARR